MAIQFAVKPSAYADEADLVAIADLINTCLAANNLENRVSVSRLREDFAEPLFEVDQDLRLWRQADGELVAVAILWRATPEQAWVGNLSFEIHPRFAATEHMALATAIVAWAEARLCQLGQGSDLPLVLHSGCRDTVEARWTLLMQLGFQPERCFLQLKRSLTKMLPKVTLPAGVCVRTVTTDDAEAWVAMFNQTFVDHWNHHPLTVEEFLHYTRSSDYDPNLDLVAKTLEGELVAFCYSKINQERNARLEVQEGHVCLLGTRRGYRRLGLARSLLTESLRRLQIAGMTTATIGVDAQNPLGALKLYESMEFERSKSSTVFQKAVFPDPTR